MGARNGGQVMRRRLGSERVAVAVEGLYSAFADVPKPSGIEGCPCCIERENTDVLLAKPLRTLAPDELSNYAASAFLTAGSSADYLYFLPRILEVLVACPVWRPDPEVVGKAISAAGHADWPERKKAALAEYIDAVWSEMLDGPEARRDMDTWICFAGRVPVRVTPLLERLLERPKRLVDLYEVNSQTLIEGRLSNGFWDEDSEEHDRVVEWLRSPAVQTVINRAYGLLS